MSVSSVSATTQAYETTAAKTAEKKDTAAEKKAAENSAENKEVVYEKGTNKNKDSANKIYNRKFCYFKTESRPAVTCGLNEKPCREVTCKADR